MTCRYSEEYLALYIESELSPAELKAVEQHVASCGECRDVAAGLRESQMAVKSLRSDTVNSRMLAHMHEQVMDELIRRRPQAWWLAAERVLFSGYRWKYALAGVTGLVLVGGIALGLLWEVRRPAAESVESEQPSPRGMPVPSAAVPVPAFAKHEPADDLLPGAVPSATRKVVRESQAKPVLGRPDDPPLAIMVKLYTDDPNVVIYWALDANGENDGKGETR